MRKRHLWFGDTWKACPLNKHYFPRKTFIGFSKLNRREGENKNANEKIFSFFNMLNLK